MPARMRSREEAVKENVSAPTDKEVTAPELLAPAPNGSAVGVLQHHDIAPDKAAVEHPAGVDPTDLEPRLQHRPRDELLHHQAA